MESKRPIDLLSKHLFWDTDTKVLSIDKNKSFIIQRVLEYGFIGDWNLIKKWYGIKEIGEVALQFRTLEPRALAFLVNITNIPINKFRCYTTKQSIPKHWNF
jgi:ribosomal protein S8